jgi:hypothetical protein
MPRAQSTRRVRYWPVWLGYPGVSSLTSESVCAVILGLYIIIIDIQAQDISSTSKSAPS